MSGRKVCCWAVWAVLCVFWTGCSGDECSSFLLPPRCVEHSCLEETYFIVNESSLTLEIEHNGPGTPDDDSQNVVQAGERAKIYRFVDCTFGDVSPKSAMGNLKAIIPDGEGSFREVSLPLEGPPWRFVGESLELTVTDEMLAAD